MAKSKKSKAPQDVIVSFWQKFLESSPSKVDCIFPPSLYDDLFAKTSETWGTQTSNNATASYAAAVEVCKEKVAKIVRECYRTNEKFSDPDYDLESDFWTWNCLRGLIRNDGDGTGAAGLSGDKLADALDTVLTGELLGTTGTEPVRVNLKGLQNILKRGDEDEEAGESDAPGSVHRVDWIFEDPNFTVDGFSNLDIRQGGLGDCWLLVLPVDPFYSIVNQFSLRTSANFLAWLLLQRSAATRHSSKRFAWCKFLNAESTGLCSIVMGNGYRYFNSCVLY